MMKNLIIKILIWIVVLLPYILLVIFISDTEKEKQGVILEKQTAKVDSDIRVDSTLRDYNAEKRAYSDSCNAELQYKYNRLYQRLENVSDKFNRLAEANKDTNCVGLILEANKKFSKYDSIVSNRNNYIANQATQISTYKEDCASFQKDLQTMTSNRDSWKKIAEKPKQKSVMFVSSGFNSFGYISAGAGYVYNHAGLELNYLTNITQQGIELKGIFKF